MKVKTTILIAMLLTVCCSWAQPADMNKRLSRADKAYVDAQYEQAISDYSYLLENDGVSPEILFNLGNAYVQTDNYGQAVLCYERALRLDPSNDRIEQNLGYVNRKIEDNNRADAEGKNVQITPDSPTFFQSVYTWLAVDRSSNMWAILAAICFILCVGMVAIYIFSKNVNLKKMGFFNALALIIVDAFLIMLAVFSYRAFNNKDECIIIDYKTPLCVEPKSDAKPATTPLNAGTKVDIIDAEEDGRGNTLWYKVRLNSDFTGWIRAKDVEII